MTYALTALAFFAALLVIGVAAFVMVIVLAGPHSDMLPQSLQVMAAIAGWLAVLVLPVLVARGVWKRVKSRRVAEQHVPADAYAARASLRSYSDGPGVSAAEPERSAQLSVSC
jgi:hypothetical protein